MGVGRVEYFPSVGSTNDVAAEWAAEGCADMSVAAADEQTEGRGRAGRKWFTPRGAALAFSVVMQPSSEEDEALSRYVGLGAVAVAEALTHLYGLAPEIKWPNDVLLAGKKTCGVLAEMHWLGEQARSLILGIGINVAPESVPEAAELSFGATCVEGELGRAVERLPLLREVVEQIIFWRRALNTPRFLQRWEDYLAYRGEWVQVFTTAKTALEGVVAGLDTGGRLRVRLGSGEEATIPTVKTTGMGEIHLRPVVDRARK